MIRAESGHAFHDSCAGDAAIEEKVEDAGVNRNPVMRSSLAQIDGDLDCFSGDSTLSFPRRQLGF